MDQLATNATSVAPVTRGVITDTLVRSLFNASGGYIVSWTIDQDLVSASDLTGFEIIVGNEPAGFTRSRLFVETEESLAGRCVEIVAVNSSGSVLDSAVAAGIACR